MSFEANPASWRAQGGHALLEMVLFLPLGIFFLFVVIDCGIYLITRAAVQDIVRAAAAAEALAAANESDASKAYDSAVGRVSADVERGVERAWPVAAAKPQLGWTVQILEAPVDPEDGRLREGRRVLAARSFGSAPGPVDLEERERFFRQELSTQEAPSRYAVPRGVQHRADAPQATRFLFAPSTQLVYVEVKTTGAGIAAPLVRAVLGRPFMITARSLRLRRKPDDGV